jgi:hypothetical protein
MRRPGSIFRRRSRSKPLVPFTWSRLRFSLFFGSALISLIFLDPSSDASVPGTYTSFGQPQAINDAISCMGTASPFINYRHSTSVRISAFSDFQLQVLLCVRPRFRAAFCWIGACGPWVEDFWQNLTDTDLSEFGYFIPLFVPWNKLFVGYRLSIYINLITTLLGHISPQFLYVTVSQNPEGIECSPNASFIPGNIFVLSQGGQGHIPLLLWLIELPPVRTPVMTVADRTAVFLGGISVHPLRETIAESVRASQNDIIFMKGGRPFGEWSTLFARSKFVLCPRGFGRSSYRLTETLQLGLVPVYVWDDVIWLPYYDSINWSSLAVVANVIEINKTLEYLAAERMEEVVAMRKRVRSLYWSHFNSVAVMGHVRRLIQGGFAASDLRCAQFVHHP